MPVAAQLYKTPATLHTASINGISWAPHDLGLVLATASSDGSAAVLEYKASDGTFDVAKVSSSAGAAERRSCTAACLAWPRFLQGVGGGTRQASALRSAAP